MQRETRPLISNVAASLWPMNWPTAAAELLRQSVAQVEQGLKGPTGANHHDRRADKREEEARLI